MRPLWSSVGTESPEKASSHPDYTCHHKTGKLSDSEHRKYPADSFLNQYSFLEDKQVVTIALFTCCRPTATVITCFSSLFLFNSILIGRKKASVSHTGAFQKKSYHGGFFCAAAIQVIT